jgi:hypothetical protein
LRTITDSRGRGAARRLRPLLHPAFALLVATALVAALLSGCSGGSDGSERGAAQGDPPGWEDPGGRWHEGAWKEGKAEGREELTPEQRAEFARLMSIGYLSGTTPLPTDTGVTIYDRSATYDALNFYTSGDFPGAILMDMRGQIIHKWHLKYIDAWRTQTEVGLPTSDKTAGYWRRAHLFDNGDVLAIFEGLGIVKVDWASDLLWANINGAHHDLDVAGDGRILVLTREPKIIPRVNPDLPILEDFIVILDPSGRELGRTSVLEAFENSAYAGVLDGMKESGDVFHTNTLEILDGSLADELPAFAAGNVLICLRELDVIAVVDLERAEVVWSLAGTWKAPHQPTVLPGGSMLLFDNKGNRGMSRVIEFDPATLEMIWSYAGAEPPDFFSRECGSNQRLPNGSTLITESDRGKAFEVAPDGTVVWKYFNPAQGGDEGEFIATLFEVIRLDPGFPLDWMRVTPERAAGG